LAEALGVSFASVNRWENGKSRPTALAWRQITRAEVLGIEGLRPGAYVADDGATSGMTVSEETSAYGPGLRLEGRLDFGARPDAVRVVAEAERLTFGHLFNPAFATEISLIDPLPHQRIAVYEHMLTQARLRFLLGDDAGAGKTIMAGLYIREMLSRRLVRRILIVPPAGLIGNWHREMRSLFSLPFNIVTGADARSSNPFIGEASDLSIVSVDTLAGERVFAKLQAREVIPYDLVIFDEAHKLSADREPDLRIRKTGRYRLGEALAGIQTDDPEWQLDWSCQHVLLLTATPHMGKDFPYYSLWRLLEPEVLSTPDAFNSYPADARARHFIRRTKEEMVRYDGTPIYPKRLSDTLSYDLIQGEVSEQALYDDTTSYIQDFYNRARILNRSAARLAMSIFQRRLASSTFALMKSFERRLGRLNLLIEQVATGSLTPEQLHALQRRDDRRAERAVDLLDTKTADEEELEDGREENEVAQEEALASVISYSLAELQAERARVQGLLNLSRQVYAQGVESKFERLREVLQDPQYRDAKMIIFTEHRDTLEFIVRRLEGLGFSGKVAQLHGGMDYLEREQQVEFFRRPAGDAGATYLVATDAAGEGINLQFCWLMINYDIPWNPARLEQRMGRIHRYGQKHDPVVILNLVSGKTREGRVLKTLLDKLERIRRELKSDKVFDVIGRVFEGVSIRQYMEDALTDPEGVERRMDGQLTEQQVTAILAKEARLYGDGGDVKRELPRLNSFIEHETYRRLMPGYIQRFIEKAAPLASIGIEGSLDAFFEFRPEKPGALDAIWPILESYHPRLRNRLTVYRPEDKSEAVFLHPGEQLFDQFKGHVLNLLGKEARRGGVFVDPTAERPYLFHLALISVQRVADPILRLLAQDELLETRLIGIRQEEDGTCSPCPVEHLLLLKGADGLPSAWYPFAAAAEPLREVAEGFILDQVARPAADQRRNGLLMTLAEREDFVRRGYDYQEADLAAQRSKQAEKARSGDSRAKGELTRIKDRQRALSDRRDEAVATLRREPELIVPGAVRFIAHALAVPSSDPADRLMHDAEVEAAAMRVSIAYELARGADVLDVSTPELARAALIGDHPGFDLLSNHHATGQRGIEVKGRAGIGDIELTENEWAKACNLRDRYWLYVVFDCASAHPNLHRVQDPFGKLIVKARGGVTIADEEIIKAAEE
jgi:superfamily II DNA or RNA helicase/transcriptional regulator with XRE-family HTH domain